MANKTNKFYNNNFCNSHKKRHRRLVGRNRMLCVTANSFGVWVLRDYLIPDIVN